ncbi:hypothetical protein [Sediminitomix flava]|uniref:Uncharacterized protein n=1 Tax=Sediminitomix flava TaxID=379075 RepID=A0A315ZF17_SEDFL|nr:hypothetical protein [Sediminitomix flava]PWJ44111.1 hypothetical protein BC781_101461 [Sediminitomix flava]
MKYLLGLFVSVLFVIGSAQAQEVGKTRGSYISLNKKSESSKVNQTSKSYLSKSSNINLNNSNEKWLPKVGIPREWNEVTGETVSDFDFNNKESVSSKAMNEASRELAQSPWNAGLYDVNVIKKGKGILEHQSTDWGSAEPPRNYRFFIKSHYLWRQSNMMYLQNGYPITGVTGNISWQKR